MVIERFVNYFLPLKVTDREDHIQRARISILVNFIGIAYGIISMLIFYFSHFKAGIISMSILISVLIVALFLFRFGISKFIIGNLISICLMVVIGIFCFYTGGINSPGISWFAIIPMIALIMVDRLNGVIWCVIASAAVLLFYYFEMKGIQIYYLNDGSVKNYVYISTSIGFIYFLFLIVRLSQEAEKKVNKELAEKNNLLDQFYFKLKSTQSQLVQSEKMASLGQLTAGVAHEINNPINFVSANITPLKRDIDEVMSLLDKYATLDENNFQSKLVEILKIKNEMNLGYTVNEIQNLLKGIEEGSKRTAEIVKGLRNFSRLDDEEMKKANINEGIDSTLVLLRNTFKQKNIELFISFGELPEIKCYPGQLNQVFMNLLANAVDAIGQNGKISIITSQENNLIKILIRDTGAGISDEVKKKIFDPFFTTKGVGKGTGLGLSISYGIIEKHHGKIEVHSEMGWGSEFVVSLPV